MKNLKLITSCILFMFATLSSSCTAITGIFKTGMGVGVFLTVVIIVIILFVVRSGSKK